MEGPRAARADEFQSVIGLINDTFRIKNNMLPTMEKEFPLLLSRDNIDNIRIISEDGRPVSVINYYPSKVMIEGCAVKCASIGAVCTDPEYRGRNYASIILDDVEKRLLADGTDILFVSGERSLYTRRGCVKTGGFNKAVITSKNHDCADIEIVDYEDKYIEDMMRIYNLDSTRFYRSKYEFINILKGSTLGWGVHSYRVFLIKYMGNVEGYIVLEINNSGGLHGSITEYAGSRDLVCKALNRVIATCGLDDLALTASVYDPIIAHLKAIGNRIENTNQYGTVKIINFVSFMDKIKPYFAQYMADDIMDAISFEQVGNTYIIKAKDQEFRVEGINAISQIIFGCSKDQDDILSTFKALDDMPSVKEFIKNVFPLPIPWVDNLNFI